MPESIDAQFACSRWRLVLGSFSQRSLPFGGTSQEINTFRNMEQLLDYLYSRSQGDDVRLEEREGGLGESVLSAAEWITKVRTLFPQQTADVLEKQALEEFHMTELLTDKKVLEQIQPDFNLLKTIMQLKHHMNGEVLQTARRIAKEVADQLRKQIEQDVKRALVGRLDRSTSSPVRSAHNLDIEKTIRRNLKHYDVETQQLVLQNVYFSSRIKKYNPKHIIIAIDESGSMTSSIIYSAVMAQIFASLSFTDIKLVIFDTSVVDLSAFADDPAQILMSVQLGGGTDIGKALRYCEQLISVPSQTAVIVVTDLYEGGKREILLNTSRNIIGSGAKLSFLTALDMDANPAFERVLGQKLADMGAFVGAMTPQELGGYIGQILN